MTKLYFILHICKVTTKWLREYWLSRRAQSIETLNFSCRLSKTRFFPDTMIRSCIPSERSRANVTVVIDTEAWWRDVDRRRFSSPATGITRARIASYHIVLRRKIASERGVSRDGKTRKKRKNRKRAKGIARKKILRWHWRGLTPSEEGRRGESGGKEGKTRGCCGRYWGGMTGWAPQRRPHRRPALSAPPRG